MLLKGLGVRSVSLACVRPWVPSPALEKAKQDKTKKLPIKPSWPGVFLVGRYSQHIPFNFVQFSKNPSISYKFS
jgi:hypothetical protein